MFGKYGLLWGSGSLTRLTRQDKLWPIAVTLLSGIALFICYLPMLRGQALLDEQFMMSWLRDGFAQPDLLHDFLRWSGPDRLDHWWLLAQPLMIAIYMLGDGTTFAFRLGGVIFHWHAAVIVFLIVRELSDRLWEKRVPYVAIATAMIFAVFPLVTEAVSWIGGRPLILAAAGFVLSLYGYIRARHYEDDRGNAYIVSVLAFIAFQCICAGAWSFFFVFMLYEMFYGPNKSKAGFDHEEYEFPFAVKPFAGNDRLNWLFPYALTALGAAALQAYAYPETLFVHTNAKDLWQIFKTLIFPVRNTVAHFHRELNILGAMLAAPTAVLILAMWKDKARRKLVIFSLLWLMISLLPYLHITVRVYSFYGTRWLYLAAIPFSLLLATALLSFRSLSHKRALVATGIGIILCSSLTVFYARHTFTQNESYRVAGKLLESLQSSVKEICAKRACNYVIVRDLPDDLAVARIVSPFRLILLDGATGLMRAPDVPAGMLKTALRAGAWRAQTLRYDPGKQALTPVDFGGYKLGDLSGHELAERVLPPLKFNHSTHYDQELQCVVPTSTTAKGPVLELNAGNLSPLEGDFLYLDTKIDAPSKKEHAAVGVYWLTTVHEHPEKRDRRLGASVRINDGMWNRNLIALDSTGWLTNGPITTFIMGFPAGAKVGVKTLGIMDGGNLIPQIASSAYPAPPDGNRYAFHCFNYPSDRELGLLTLYNGGAGVTINCPEENQSASMFLAIIREGQVLKTLPAIGAKLFAETFPKSGIYQIRIVKPTPNRILYSSSLYCLVDKEAKTAMNGAH